MFERLMNMGIKELYYKDAAPREMPTSPLKTTKPTSDSNSALSEKERVERERKRRLLELNQEDSAKTSLKKRSNMIFNRLLRDVDLELHQHVQAMEV